MFTYKKVRDKWRVMQGEHIYKLADGKPHDGGGYPELDDCLTHIRSINYTKVHSDEIQVLRQQKQPEIKRKQPEIKSESGLDVQREPEQRQQLPSKLRQASSNRSTNRSSKRVSSNRKRQSQSVSP